MIMVTNRYENSTSAALAPILALDYGTKRVGVAVSDELSIAITRLNALPRKSWKQMLLNVEALIRRFDAQTLVIGLPLRLNGSSGDAALQVQAIAAKFARSLTVPVYLQDERLTSVEAEENLRVAGHDAETRSAFVDSEAAAIILRDFLVSSGTRLLVSPGKQPL